MRLEIYVAHELFQSVFRMENFLFRLIAFFVLTHVGKCDGEACIQICQLTHTVGEDVVLEGSRVNMVHRARTADVYL
jgi:hypothetical protein